MRNSTKVLWTGRAMSGLVILFMIFDVTIKYIALPVVEQSGLQLSLPTGSGRGLAVMETIILVLYAVPRTSILGAILFTGLFGGTMALHWRVGDPLFSHILFGFYLGLLAWGGLYLRDEKLRELIPFRTKEG